MRFVSLFSGIEAATCAWSPLGWVCAAVAEVEPFPCALLKHHYPEVPNLGDVTKITAEQIKALGHIDLVCGGFPCQDLSVAGKRKGLKNADGTSTRSGLFFDAMRIADWANPRWLFIENVPGMFSSNAGRDFAAVVGEMAGCEFDVPRDGWRNAGVVVGPRGLVEWSVMDAQYHGLAQRRKRVFIVRDSGDWTSRAPIFLEPYRLQGHPAPSRQAGKATTRGVEFGPSGGRFTDVNPTLYTRAKDGPIRNQLAGCVATLCVATGQAGAEIGADMAPTLNCNHEAPYIAHSLRGEGFDASEDGTGRGTPLVPILAFDTTNITSKTNASNPQPGDPCHTLAKGAHAPAIAFQERGRAGGPNLEIGGDLAFALTAPNGGGRAQERNIATAMQVRRLTPTECERLQGFPDGYTNVPVRGKPAADGPRYKGLGNSWAVPNVRWIGRRIDAVSHIQRAQVAIKNIADRAPA